MQMSRGGEWRSVRTAAWRLSDAKFAVQRGERDVERLDGRERVREVEREALVRPALELQHRRLRALHLTPVLLLLLLLLLRRVPLVGVCRLASPTPARSRLAARFVFRFSRSARRRAVRSSSSSARSLSALSSFRNTRGVQKVLSLTQKEINLI